MSSMRRKLSVVLPVFVLLFCNASAQAFSFCFSFGGGDSRRGHYDDYLPPIPGNLPGMYRGYSYSPVPAYPGYGSYYPIPPGMPGMEPTPGAAFPGSRGE